MSAPTGNSPVDDAGTDFVSTDIESTYSAAANIEGALSALRLPSRSARLHPPELGTAGDVRYLVDDTALGRMLFAARSSGSVLAVVFAPTDPDVDRVVQRIAGVVSPRVLRGGAVLDPVRRELAQYVAGQRKGFDVAVDLVLATPFQRMVLQRLAAGTGYGMRTTYGRLAADLGRPTASRAVGAALGANPLCVLLPCHRVVSASGSLTGYAGGLAAKEALLAVEARD